MIVGAAVLLPLSQYFGGPVFSSGVFIDQVDPSGGEQVEITASMTVDAMAMMRYEWFDAQGQAIHEPTFFAMTKPYGPGGMTPTFVSYESPDANIIGIAQRSNPNEILILLNRPQKKNWPSQQTLDDIGRHETDGIDIDVTSEAVTWLSTLRESHPALIDELVWPSKRELVTPVAEGEADTDTGAEADTEPDTDADAN